MISYSINNISFKAKPVQYPALIDKDLSDTIDSVVGVAYRVKDIVEHMSPSKRTPFLKKHNVAKVYADFSNGIVFNSQDNDFVLSSHAPKTMRLLVKNKSNGHVVDSFYVRERKLAKSDTSKGIPNKVEFYMDKASSLEREKKLKSILDELDFRLLKMRLAKTGNDVPKFILAPRVEPKGYLSDIATENVLDIINNFWKINENINKAKSRATRVKIKAAYPKIQKGISGTKNMTFLGIGPNKEDISVNVLRVRGKQHLVLKVSQPNLPDKNIIVCPDGSVQKQPSMAFIRDANVVGKDNVTTYYTQSELCDSNINNYLISLKNEIRSYSDYVRSTVARMESKREFRTTTDVGTIDKFGSLMKSVSNNYDYFKTNIVRYSPLAQNRKALRDRHNIVTQGHPALIFKKITDDRNDLYLSFPKTQGKRVMKLIEMKGDNVLNTFLVDDNKLVKFEVKSMNCHKINNLQQINYHSQDYIDRSPLENYLSKINRVLNLANSEIKDAINARKG